MSALGDWSTLIGSSAATMTHMLIGIFPTLKLQVIIYLSWKVNWGWYAILLHFTFIWLKWECCRCEGAIYTKSSVDRRGYYVVLPHQFRIQKFNCAYLEYLNLDPDPLLSIQSRFPTDESLKSLRAFWTVNIQRLSPWKWGFSSTIYSSTNWKSPS